jgi:hypothetical protein
MVYATYSFGTATGTPTYNGFRPPYKIGDYFNMPDIATRLAPGFSGDAAKCLLVRGVAIAVGGRNTTSADSRFGLWNDDGSNGYFSAAFKLPNVGTSNPSRLYKALASSKPVLANQQYIVGFLKRDTELVQWARDDGASGNIWQDTSISGDSSNFKNNSAYTSGASLVATIYYDALPNVPNSTTTTVSGNTITLTWASPTLVSGETAITGYRIQRSLDNSTWTTLVANTGAGVTSYVDSGRAWSTTYYYRVAAHNDVSTTFGTAYSGPYAASVSRAVGAEPNPALPGKAASTLEVTVSNPNPVPIAFSDRDGEGIPYEDIQVVYGSEYLYNRITVGGREFPDEPVTVDATTGVGGSSQSIYGVRGYDIGSDLLNLNYADLTTLANRVLYKTYQPNLRVEAVTVRVNKLEGEQLESVLNLDVDGVIAVYFTPNNVGSQVVTVGRVIGVSHEIDVESHVVTFRLQSMDSSPFVLDTQAFGVLDVNVLG